MRGDIMTGELFTANNPRKFIPVTKGDEWSMSAPSWLLGNVYLDLGSTGALDDQAYARLRDLLHGNIPQAPPIGEHCGAESAQKQVSDRMFRAFNDQFSGEVCSEAELFRRCISS